MAEPAGPSVAARYAVIGHPVAHSLSPQIHAAFALQTGASIDYRRVLAPLDGFAATVERFVADGGRGFNVTVPFKRDAFALCGMRVAERARHAGAVNCVTVDPSGLVGDNTDGIGLVRDLMRIVGGDVDALRGRRLLLLGAGGAARGVAGPLLDAGVRTLVVASRDARQGAALAAEVVRARDDGRSIDARSFEALDDASFDVVVNATSASLAGELPPLPPAVLANAALVYDMMYAASRTPFLAAARAAGDAAVADGLGMLVEQAAASYRLWRGVEPDTAPVLSQMRALLQAANGHAA